jgi:hypothetical protein
MSPHEKLAEKFLAFGNEAANRRDIKKRRYDLKGINRDS